MDDLERRVDRMLEDETQEVDPGLIQELMALPPGTPGGTESSLSLPRPAVINRRARR